LNAQFFYLKIKAMATKTASRKPSKRQPKSEEATSYDEWKQYEGEYYKGMKIGRSHKWYYDKGVWRDKKITPDLWQINYAVTKRRAGKAPEGSGVPVGTEYHWYIVAHQMVKKLDANDYTTSMSGLKFKVAHLKADTQKWSATPKTQRKRMIKFLQDIIEDLEQQENFEPESHSIQKTPDSKSKNNSKGASANGRKNGTAKKAVKSRTSSSNGRKNSTLKSSSGKAVH
jgi:hypothetical protein